MRILVSLKQILIATLLLAPLTGFAKPVVIQILHTNDLHAALRTAGAPSLGQAELGGWPQLKAKLDELKADAKRLGIETIQVDAGDYTEGTLDYFPDQGVHVLKAFQHMGYDAATIGNHDWLMGARGMDELYGKSPFPFPLLSANIEINSSLKNLKKQIQPSTQIIRNGVKIGIFGLSTDESLYSWIPKIASKRSDFKIQSYDDTSISEEDAASIPGSKIDPNGNYYLPGTASTLTSDLRETNDVVIAMTHIGFAADQWLASNSNGGLDLIIGGHSHTFLETATSVKDKTNRDVPIVQTGFNGNCIGQVIIEVDPEKTPKMRVISYGLIPISHTGPADPVITQDLADAENALVKQYGPALDEVLGTSSERLISGDNGPTAYSQFIVDAIRAANQTDIAIDVGAFHGNTPQDGGLITRRKLMMMYPRKFEASQNEGLYIYQTSVFGILLKIGLEYSIKFGNYVALSGITYDLKKLSNADFAKLKAKYAGSLNENAVTPYYPSNILVHGQPLDLDHKYSVSAPESLIRGALALSPLVQLVLNQVHRTPHTIWDASFQYLAQIKKILPAPLNAAYSSQSDVPLFNSLGDPTQMMNEGIREAIESSIMPF